MRSNSWTPPVWLPFTLLVGTIGYLVVQWSVHPVTGSQVIGPVILLISGLIVCCILEAILYLNNLQLKGETNKHLDPEANRILTAVTQDIVRIVELCLAIPFTVGSVLGLDQRGGIWPVFPILVFLSVGLAIFVACMRLINCAKDLHARGLDKGLEGWKGVVYVNKNDPRIWVPKIGSIGYTLNFAHSRSWVILALLISPAIFVAVLGLVVQQWR